MPFGKRALHLVAEGGYAPSREGHLPASHFISGICHSDPKLHFCSNGLAMVKSFWAALGPSRISNTLHSVWVVGAWGATPQALSDS